jgi:anaerobic selenocysteine-containing dehydrogenase
MFKDPEIELSPKVADEVKYTTCYMCACRCGIKVQPADGQVRYIAATRPPGQQGRALRQGQRPASCSTIRRRG